MNNFIIGQKYWTFLAKWKNLDNAALGVYSQPWEGILAKHEYGYYILIDPNDLENYTTILSDEIYEDEISAFLGAAKHAREEMDVLIEQGRVITEYIDSIKKRFTERNSESQQTASQNIKN